MPDDRKYPMGSFSDRLLDVDSIEVPHPPTHAVGDEETGVLRQAETKTPGSLGKDPVDCARVHGERLAVSRLPVSSGAT
ncbi:hypothetical protein QFZ58_000023 [Streptomyces sp. B1I3]|nr:hypothetical protein [Streptomyces sp. B1I3]